MQAIYIYHTAAAYRTFPMSSCFPFSSVCPKRITDAVQKQYCS